MGRKAFSAITMLVIMLILGVVGAVTSSIVLSTFESSYMYLQSQQAFYSAQAGLEWVGKAVTFVSGSDRTTAGGSRAFFKITNNTGANITVSGLTASWSWSAAPPDDTIFYEKVRIDGGAFSKDYIWDYTVANSGLPASTRAGRGDAITFNTGPTVTLVSGTPYEFAFYNFKKDQTGSSSNGSINDSILRCAFKFTPNSFTVGQGTFTIAVPAVATTENAAYVSTATVGSAQRKLQMASLMRFGPLAAGAGLIVGTPAPNTLGPSGEDMKVQVSNESGANITVTSFVGSWSGSRYYDQAILGGVTVFSGSTPRKGSLDTVSFADITINDGTKKKLELNNFRDVATGSGNRTSLSGVAVQIQFSDGSTLSFTPS